MENVAIINKILQIVQKKNRLFDFYEMIQNRPQIYEI